MKILNCTQAGALLGIHPRTVSDWALKGILPGRRFGTRLWKFVEKDLLDWVEDQKTTRQEAARVRKEMQREFRN